MNYQNLILNLIKTLPNFDCIDDEGNNICHHLAKYGNLNIFDNLIKKHNPNWGNILNQRNDVGQTPLHIAVKNNNQKLANKFVKLGAKENILDIYGNSCIKNNNQLGGGYNKKIIKGTRYL